MLTGSALATGLMAALAGGQGAEAACFASGAAPTLISCDPGTTTTTAVTRDFLVNDDVSASVGATSIVDGFGLGVTVVGAPHAIGFANAGTIASTDAASINAVDLAGNGGLVTYTGDGGLFSANGAGLSIINIGTGGVAVGAPGAPILATIEAAGDGIAVSTAAGTVDVEFGGTIGGLATPVGGEGIHVDSAAAVPDAVVITNTGSILSAGAGIHALAFNGGATVNAFGDIASTGTSAIVTDTALGSTINVGFGKSGFATVSGVGDPANPVIDIISPSGQTSTLNLAFAGRVQSNGGFLDDLAVRGTGGSVVVNSEGVLVGRVDFSALGLTDTATVNNDARGEWLTAGTSTFGPNADTVNNAGLLMVDGATRFEGLEAFNNSGTVSLGFDPVHLTNGLTGDTLTMPGTAFHGSGGSRLAVDAFLGGPGSPSDRLVLPGGSTSGTTRVLVHDTNAGFGANNPGGIPIVDVGGGVSHAGDFVLDPASTWFNGALLGGVLDKPGLFMYDVVFNPATQQHVLASALNVTALQLPSIMTGAQDLWYRSSPWLERQADMRDAVGGGRGTGTPGAWAKGFGDWGSRDSHNTLSAFGKSQSIDTGYDQNVAGGVVGADFGRHGVWQPDDTVLGGIMGGYVWSEMNFKTAGTAVQFTGPVMGLYGTYMRNGFFVDGQIKADVLQAELRGGPGRLDKRVNVYSVGGMIDAGQRIPLGFGGMGTWGTFVEPLATIAYVHTMIDNFTDSGTSVDFQDGDSLRGSLGLRLGAQPWTTADYVLEVSATGRVWNEFLDDKNKVEFGGAGPNTEFSHKFEGLYGEAGGTVNLISKTTGWSGFISGSYQFADNYDDARVIGGLRYHF